jgi:TonB family protein
MPDPPRQLQRPGHDRVSIPVTPSNASLQPIDVQPISIDAIIPGSREITLAGAISGVPDGASRGRGVGPGSGEHTGNGDGPGRGDGGGAGDRDGCCEGPFQPGSGVEPARVVKQVRPNYTIEAVQARVQGEVWVECVILADGTVGSVRVIRSLDTKYGLDREAVNAAKQWRFVPGTRNGKPVAVVATIALTFSLH